MISGDDLIFCCFAESPLRSSLRSRAQRCKDSLHSFRLKVHSIWILGRYSERAEQSLNVKHKNNNKSLGKDGRGVPLPYSKKSETMLRPLLSFFGCRVCAVEIMSVVSRLRGPNRKHTIMTPLPVIYSIKLLNKIKYMRKHSLFFLVWLTSHSFTWRGVYDLYCIQRSEMFWPHSDWTWALLTWRCFQTFQSDGQTAREYDSYFLALDVLVASGW